MEFTVVGPGIMRVADVDCIYVQLAVTKLGSAPSAWLNIVHVDGVRIPCTGCEGTIEEAHKWFTAKLKELVWEAAPVAKGLYLNNEYEFLCAQAVPPQGASILMILGKKTLFLERVLVGEWNPFVARMKMRPVLHEVAVNLKRIQNVSVKGSRTTFRFAVPDAKEATFQAENVSADLTQLRDELNK
ncbi:MAG: hypothetical protein WC712_10760 [Candidatus Brocadiia bacterium]